MKIGQTMLQLIELEIGLEETHLRNVGRLFGIYDNRPFRRQILKWEVKRAQRYCISE